MKEIKEVKSTNESKPTNESDEESDDEPVKKTDKKKRVPLGKRIFVCVGKMAGEPDPKKKAHWVMTLDDECRVVTMWDPQRMMDV